MVVVARVRNLLLVGFVREVRHHLDIGRRSLTAKNAGSHGVDRLPRRVKRRDGVTLGLVLRLQDLGQASALVHVERWGHHRSWDAKLGSDRA